MRKPPTNRMLNTRRAISDVRDTSGLPSRNAFPAITRRTNLESKGPTSPAAKLAHRIVGLRRAKRAGQGIGRY